VSGTEREVLVRLEKRRGGKVSEPVADGGQEPNRRDFIYIAAGAGAAGAAAMVAVPLIGQMNPAADTLALASIEYDLSKVEEGMQAVVKWRNKPLFVRYRTKKEIAEANAVDIKTLRDPQTDAERVKAGHEQYLILVGVCTCHGSQYDTSGRIRGGPAPKNLEVPEYSFLSDTKIKVG
jgi:ubiquinol-cytochrome c reductase iron-sulfur subunit